MPLQPTSGAASYDAFGGGVAAVPNYIEDVFSTYLYTGNGSTQTISNGIDLSTKGGLVWTKTRSSVGNHLLRDTARGTNYGLYSNLTNSQINGGSAYSLSLGTSSYSMTSDDGDTNATGITYASWTFRKQPKFFDVVTWTGSNDSGTSIGQGIVPHNLGSAPGCVIIKNVTQGATNWIVYHRSLSGGYRVLLNTTDAQTNSGSAAYFSKYDNSVGWVQTDPDANNIYVGYNYQTNGNGDTLVAYLFAHNAGGFGLTGTDNVISCGSGTVGTEVNLGYEPQFVIMKRSTLAGQWYMLDNMRGWNVSGDDQYVSASSSGAESAGDYGYPTATGFYPTGFGSTGNDFIYIAIRRGPMKVPTSGTSVFSPIKAYNATGTKNTTNFAVDLQIAKNFTDGGSNNVNDRLRGVSSISTETTTSGPFLYTDTTAAEVQAYRTLGWDNTGFKTPGYFSNYDIIFYNFKRAPSFFDEVCFGSSVTTAVPHNLAAVPELIIAKDRSGSGAWYVWQPSTSVRYGTLNTTTAFSAPAGSWPATSTTFEPLIYGSNIANYLFATCAGVSKVGSYTGNGSTQTINCGFTGGARFVLIKRTDSTGDWYVWDTARGIISANDPHLSLNTTSAEVTTDDTIDTDSTGFIVNQVSATNVNVSSATYIYLAIA